MEELARFFRDVSWTGTIVEGGMGPGTPEMTASGSGSHELIQDAAVCAPASPSIKRLDRSKACPR
jgi:hypothetical protein